MANKVHNSNADGKAELRRRLVTCLGGPLECLVLETHSGPGTMHELAYRGVSDWVGIDEDKSSPGAIHADNRMVMRSIGLSRFNVLDVDAYGSPWELLWIFSKRRPIDDGERVAIALTSGINGICGAKPTVKGAGWSRQMADAVGASEAIAHKWYTGVNGANLLAQRLVSAWFPGCKKEMWLSMRSHKGGAWYFGTVLRGAPR